MNKITSADLKLFRALFDSAYVTFTELNLRVFIRCSADIAEINPVLIGAVYKSPTGNKQHDFVNLNITPAAIRDFVYGSDCVSFSTRFSGTAKTIIVPYSMISAMYSPDVVTSSVYFNLGLVTEEAPVPPPEETAKPKTKLSVVK